MYLSDLLRGSAACRSASALHYLMVWPSPARRENSKRSLFHRFMMILRFPFLTKSVGASVLIIIRALLKSPPTRLL